MFMSEVVVEIQTAITEITIFVIIKAGELLSLGQE